MPEAKTVPYDYSKQIQNDKDARTMLEGEISVIDRTITLREKDLKETGFVDKKQIRELNIRKAQKKQRCVALTQRINSMEEKQNEKTKGDKKDPDNGA